MRKALKTSPTRPVGLIKTVCTIPKYHWLINKFNEQVKKAGYEQCAIPSTIYDEPDTTTVLLKRGKA